MDARAELFPFCVHLESKKVLLAAARPRERADVLDASNHCWCGLTQQVRGRDGGIAHPDDCRRGRSCFRGVLEAPL